jgi:hypothetical protein
MARRVRGEYPPDRTKTRGEIMTVEKALFKALLAYLDSRGYELDTSVRRDIIIPLKDQDTLRLPVSMLQEAL